MTLTFLHKTLLSVCGVLVVLFAACRPPQDVLDADSGTPESRGLTLLLESMDAHGGKEAWYAAGLLQFRWAYHMSDRGADVIVDTLQTIDPESLAVVHEVSDKSTRFGWNGGSTWIAPENAEFMPPPQFWALTPFYFFGIPFVFDDPNARFELLTEVIPFEGNYYSQVRVTFTPEAGDSPDDWYILLIDPVTKLTRAAIYTVTSTLVAPDGPIPPKLITLDDLEYFGGLLLPTGHRTFEIKDGEIGNQIRHTEVSEIAWLERGSVDLGIPENSKVFE